MSSAWSSLPAVSFYFSCLDACGSKPFYFKSLCFEGADAVLTKPLNKSRFESCVRRFMSIDVSYGNK
jgi:hypothetical protein